jgi:hypothetical protein
LSPKKAGQEKKVKKDKKETGKGREVEDFGQAPSPLAGLFEVLGVCGGWLAGQRRRCQRLSL